MLERVAIHSSSGHLFHRTSFIMTAKSYYWLMQQVIGHFWSFLSLASSSVPMPKCALSWKAPVFHFFAERAQRLPYGFSELRIAFDKTRQESVEKAQNIMNDQDLTIALGSGAYADGRDRHRFRDLSRDRSGDGLQDDTEAPRFDKRLGVFDQESRGLGRFAWTLKPPSCAELWGVRPIWPCTGIPALTMARTCGATFFPPSVSPPEPPLLQEAPGVEYRLFDAHL